jgi:hypothetical protein
LSLPRRRVRRVGRKNTRICSHLLPLVRAGWHADQGSPSLRSHRIARSTSAGASASGRTRDDDGDVQHLGTTTSRRPATIRAGGRRAARVRGSDHAHRAALSSDTAMVADLRGGKTTARQAAATIRASAQRIQAVSSSRVAVVKPATARASTVSPREAPLTRRARRV